jgi:hypothetical protein
MHARRLAGAWFWITFMLSALRRAGGKPRLNPVSDKIDALLAQRRKCRDITRFSPGELARLAADLHINWGAPAVGNWRFSPCHRLVLFLLCFSNAWPSRKLELAVGWAANAVLNNWRWHIDQILLHLDAEGSRE